jgi:uncharacterized protein (DUF3820 family)
MLTDTSKMPLGKYKGVTMTDVPAEYLHWFWHNSHDGQDGHAKDIRHYIKGRLSGLKMENKDLIWS